jgi:hypothetical protein
VPLQAKALEALDRLSASDNPILFPNARGGRVDFRIFGRKHWRPAQTKREHAVALLDALALERAVDAAWTFDLHAPQANQEDRCGLSSAPPAPARGRSVDAAPRFCRLTRRRKELNSRDDAKPSDGLEPSTPS